MKKLILISFAVIVVFGAGCISKPITNSYDAYLKTAGKEYMEYVNTGKYPDGTPMSENDKAARKLQYDTSCQLIDLTKTTYKKWSLVNW